MTMTTTTTATDQPPVTALMVEQARDQADRASENYRQLQQRMNGVLSDEQALALGEAKARAAGTAEALERLIEVREAQEAVISARRAREDHAKADISRLDEDLAASRQKLLDLVTTAESALLAALRHAERHDTLVTEAQRALQGRELTAMPGHDFATLATTRGARLGGRMWLRVDSAGVLVRSLQRVVRAMFPQSHQLSRNVDGLARTCVSRLGAELFTDAPDLGVAEQPQIIRPERAELRPTVVRTS